MNSDKKIAANRINAKKSTGPKTSRGKSRASGNARRHGWAAVRKTNSALSVDVERMTKAICGDHATAAQYEQAVTIAECEILLLKLRAARVAAIERNRIVRPTPERSNLLPGFPTNEEWAVGFEALERGQPRPVTRLFTRAVRAILAADAKPAESRTEAKTEAKSPGRAGIEQLSPLLKIRPVAAAQRTIEDQPAAQPRDDGDAFKRALPELITLDRYERRIMSRRQRAIRMFEAMSVVGPFLYRQTKGTE
jgi:hypothetical protein